MRKVTAGKLFEALLTYSDRDQTSFFSSMKVAYSDSYPTLYVVHCLVKEFLGLVYQWVKQQSLTCSIMEKPLAGLDDCLNTLLACFRKRMSDRDIVPEGNLEEVNSVLSDTNWDMPNLEELRPVRNRLCELMGIPPPAVVKKVVA